MEGGAARGGTNPRSTGRCLQCWWRRCLLVGGGRPIWNPEFMRCGWLMKQEKIPPDLRRAGPEGVALRPAFPPSDMSKSRRGKSPMPLYRNSLETKRDFRHWARRSQCRASKNVKLTLFGNHPLWRSEHTVLFDLNRTQFSSQQEPETKSQPLCVVGQPVAPRPCNGNCQYCYTV